MVQASIPIACTLRASYLLCKSWILWSYSPVKTAGTVASWEWLAYFACRYEVSKSGFRFWESELLERWTISISGKNLSYGLVYRLTIV